MNAANEAAVVASGATAPIRPGHRRERLLVFLVGIGLVSVGGVLGHALPHPLWCSTGMVHVRPGIAPLLRLLQWPDDTLTPTSNLDAQTARLKQPRVIDSALQSPEWRALNRRGTNDEAWSDFVARLQVAISYADGTVTVTFTDPDPAACIAAVGGLLRAYSTMYLEKDQWQHEHKLGLLDSFRIACTSERDAKREAILAIAREFGTDDLRPLHQARQIVVDQLTTELQLIESKLAGVPAGEPASPSRRELESSSKRHQELIETKKKEARDLGLKMLDIERLRMEERDKDATLAEIVKYIETLRTVDKLAGRAEIVAWGDHPVCIDDKRPLFAGLGAAAGLLLGLGLVGATRRRQECKRARDLVAQACV